MEQTNLHLGVDLHLKNQRLTLMDKEGNNKIKLTLLNSDREELFEFYNNLPRSTSIVLEATYNWPWFVDLLEDLGFKPKLSHPKKTRIIAESAFKNDDFSSETLAHLDRLNFLPLSYIPSKEERLLREILRMRLFFSKLRTALKTRTHSLLAKWGISYDYSDLFGNSGLEFLKNLDLQPIYKLCLNKHIEAISYLDKEIHQMQKLIKEQGKENPNVKLLTTIPGIGLFSALLLAVEIGPISRFPSYKKLISYAGLSSRVFQSADKTRYGHINKDSNPFIRWILIEAVNHAIFKDPKLRILYTKVLLKKGKSKARVACARKLLVSIYFMLKNRQPYKLSHNFGERTTIFSAKPL